jgi:SAM-dependent methyltransferase
MRILNETGIEAQGLQQTARCEASDGRCGKFGLMLENPSSEWAAARGEKWRDSLEPMESMLSPLDEPLVHALHLTAPCRIADVGCGGGGTTRAIWRQAPVGSVVHGFDISPALIEAARAKTPPHERDVVFSVADVGTAPLPELLYDRLVSRLGIMFFDDPPIAFSNLVQWLVLGGRLTFAAWGPPADNPWITDVRLVAAQFTGIPQPEPDAPGPFRYADVIKLLGLLERAGCAELEVNDWRGKLSVGGGLPPNEAATFAFASLSSFSEQLAQAGEQVIGEAHRVLAERFAKHKKDGLVYMPARVHIITGIRSVTR